MGQVIVTLEIMPESPETDLEKVYEKVLEIIKNFKGESAQKKIEPIAFGLKKLIVHFMLPETDFNEEQFLEKIQKIEGVESAQIVNVTRNFLG